MTQLHRYELYSRLTQDTSTLLEACGWPPPLTGGNNAKPPAGAPPEAASNGPPNGGDADAGGSALQGDGHAAAPPGGKGAAAAPHGPALGFTGFTQDPARLSQLLAVLTCLTSLQQAVDRQGFAEAEAAAAAAAAGEQGAGHANGHTPGQGAPPPGHASAAIKVRMCGGLVRAQIWFALGGAGTERARQHCGHCMEGGSGAGMDCAERARVRASSRARAQEAPLLWAATCLAGPLQAKLQLHFQPHTQAGRLDQPAWLFKLVTKLVKVGGHGFLSHLLSTRCQRQGLAQ